MNRVYNYLNDGSNWQAKCVLAYLGSMPIDDELTDLTCGRYENGREQGYVFSVRRNDKQRNYAVYEHRNSDDLCVVVNDIPTFNTPPAKVMYDSMENKYDVTKSFRCGEIMECGTWIYEDICDWIDADKEENEAC